MAYYNPTADELLKQKETLDKFWAAYPEVDQKNIEARIVVGRSYDVTASEYGIWLRIKGVRPPLFHRFIVDWLEDRSGMKTIHEGMHHILSLVPSFLVKNYRQPPANWRFN